MIVAESFESEMGPGVRVVDFARSKEKPQSEASNIAIGTEVAVLLTSRNLHFFYRLYHKSLRCHSPLPEPRQAAKDSVWKSSVHSAEWR